MFRSPSDKKSTGSDNNSETVLVYAEITARKLNDSLLKNENAVQSLLDKKEDAIRELIIIAANAASSVTLYSDAKEIEAAYAEDAQKYGVPTRTGLPYFVAELLLPKAKIQYSTSDNMRPKLKSDAKVTPNEIISISKIQSISPARLLSLGFPITVLETLYNSTFFNPDSTPTPPGGPSFSANKKA